MSRCWRGAVAIAAAMVSGIGTVEAADLYSRGMKDYSHRQALANPATWYLRLDGGFVAPGEPTLASGGSTFISSGIGDTWSLGAGVGRYLSANLRADLTAEYHFDADVRGRNTAVGATFPGPHRFGLENTILLANAYYDFNRAGTINPYLGAGLGMVHHQVNAGVTRTGGSIGSDSSWSAAGALTAGFTVALTQGLQFDAGYRFLYLGDTSAGGVRNAAGTVVAGPSVDDIYAHEFRFGVRWDVR